VSAYNMDHTEHVDGIMNGTVVKGNRVSGPANSGLSG